MWCGMAHTGRGRRAERAITWHIVYRPWSPMWAASTFMSKPELLMWQHVFQYKR